MRAEGVHLFGSCSWCFYTLSKGDGFFEGDNLSVLQAQVAGSQSTNAGTRSASSSNDLVSFHPGYVSDVTRRVDRYTGKAKPATTILFMSLSLKSPNDDFLCTYPLV